MLTLPFLGILKKLQFDEIMKNYLINSTLQVDLNCTKFL